MNASSKLKRFRRATPDDADAVIDLIVDINRKVGAVYGIRMEAESVIQTVIHTIHRGICMVGPNACAGGFISPYVWNRRVQIGTVLFWNYTKPSGVHVFEALAAEFSRLGASHISCSSHFPENKVGRLYLKMNSTPCEIQYIARIEAMTPLITNKSQEVACPL